MLFQASLPLENMLDDSSHITLQKHQEEHSIKAQMAGNNQTVSVPLKNKDGLMLRPL